MLLQDKPFLSTLVRRLAEHFEFLWKVLRISAAKIARKEPAYHLLNPNSEDFSE